MKVSKEGYHHPRPNNCPQRIWEDVIEPCFVTESKDRPSFIQLLNKLVSFDVGPEAVGSTRRGPAGSLHIYEGINTVLDMTLQRGDICPSVLETSKWAQEQAVMLEQEPMGEKKDILLSVPMGENNDRRRTQREQGLPPPMYAGSPKFEFRPVSVGVRSDSEPSSTRPSFEELSESGGNKYQGSVRPGRFVSNV